MLQDITTNPQKISQLDRNQWVTFFSLDYKYLAEKTKQPQTKKPKQNQKTEKKKNQPKNRPTKTVALVIQAEILLEILAYLK